MLSVPPRPDLAAWLDRWINAIDANRAGWITAAERSELRTLLWFQLRATK